MYLFKNKEILLNLKEIIFSILVIGLFFYVWNGFLLGSDSVPPKQSQKISQALLVNDLVGQETKLDTNFYYLISKRESWQFFKKQTDFLQKNYEIDPLKSLNFLIISLIFLGSIFAFITSYGLSKDFYFSIVVTLFSILGPPTLYAVSQDVSALIPFLCFWPLLFFFSRFFSGKPSFLYIVIPAFLCGIILNSTFFSLGFVILFSALILAFSINSQNLKIEKYTYFLLNFFIFLGLALGFSGSVILELLMREGIQNQPFPFFDLHSLNLIFLPKVQNGIYLFSGFSFLVLGLLGLFYHWYRYFLVTIFLVIFVFLSLGIFGNFGESYGIFLQSFVWGILFFWIFFAGKGLQTLKQKKTVGSVFASLFLILIIFESVFWITEKKVIDFSNPNEEIKLSRFQTEILEGVKFYLKKTPGWKVIDDGNILPKNIWTNSGIVLGEKEWVENFNYLDSQGVAIIFSDRIISPNPNHFESIKIYKESAWLNKKVLSELYFYPEQNIKNSTSEKIKYRYENGQIDFLNEAFVSQEIDSTAYFTSDKKLLSESLKLKTIFRDSYTWLISANITEKGILSISHSRNPEWKITINDRPLEIFSVNEHFAGFPLYRGNYEIKIQKLSPLLFTGKIAFKRTFYLALSLLILELAWKKRKIFTKSKNKKSTKK